MKQQIEETAEKICRLTGFGQALHPNDIIPDIKSSIIKVLEQLVEREEGAKGNSTKKLQHEKGFNAAKQDTISYLQSLIKEL